jgi:hypothetical protein
MRRRASARGDRTTADVVDQNRDAVGGEDGTPPATAGRVHVELEHAQRDEFGRFHLVGAGPLGGGGVVQNILFLRSVGVDLAGRRRTGVFARERKRSRWTALRSGLSHSDNVLNSVDVDAAPPNPRR